MRDARGKEGKSETTQQPHHASGPLGEASRHTSKSQRFHGVTISDSATSGPCTWLFFCNAIALQSRLRNLCRQPQPHSCLPPLLRGTSNASPAALVTSRRARFICTWPSVDCWLILVFPWVATRCFGHKLLPVAAQGARAYMRPRLSSPTEGARAIGQHLVQSRIPSPAFVKSAAALLAGETPKTANSVELDEGAFATALYLPAYFSLRSRSCLPLGGRISLLQLCLPLFFSRAWVARLSAD